MKLAVVYDPLDNKVREDTYSYIYRGMLDAIIDRFGPLVITKDCNAADIDADVVLFWDVNSCHHIKIDGIKNHPSLKLEYMSDPYQKEVKGIYQRYNMYVHKLSAEQRLKRALDRGVEYIVSSNKEGYFRYFSPVLGQELAENMLIYFPHAPWFESGKQRLSDRKLGVLANGSVSQDEETGYAFRYWAFQRPQVNLVKHYLIDRAVPMGKDYGELLKQWASGLALCDVYPVPKFYEMPNAGCVTFMSYFKECEDLGFKDYEVCVYVNRNNFDGRVNDFINDPISYQAIADNGRKLMEEKYSAKCFAEYIEDELHELKGETHAV